MGQPTAIEAPASLWTYAFRQLLCVEFLGHASCQMILPILPLFITTIGGEESAVGLLVGVGTVSASVFRPFAGWMVDSFGRRPFLLVGLAIFSLSPPFYSLATVFSALISLRIIQGFGWATFSPALAMMTADVIPRNRRGEGIGYMSSARSLALAIGPAAGLYLSQAFGYGASFALASATCLLGLPVCWPIPEAYTPPKVPPRFLMRDLI